jgi:predicted transcriptional regulator
MKLSKVYTVDPSSIRFDDKYVVFNPLHNDLEYEATKENIRRLGQLDPILMLDGKCIDGRHRTKIATELGVHVRCVDIDKDTSEQDIIIMCNKNVMSGRDYDSAQKAIQALELVNKYKMSTVDSAKFMKVDRKAVSYAATIKGYGRQDILDVLMEDKRNRVHLENMERPSRSLELLAKFVKTIDEKDKVVIDNSERIQWSADAYIKTESGKAWYYNTVSLYGVTDIGLLVLLGELANYKHKFKEEE